MRRLTYARCRQPRHGPGRVGTGRALKGERECQFIPELRCWQLANELRREVNAICAIEVVQKEFRFCTSFRDCSSSVCRNIAEGFDRFKSAEIVQFFRYALASLAEVQDHLEECQSREFIDPSAFTRLWDLTEHTKAATLKFKRFHEHRKHR